MKAEIIKLLKDEIAMKELESEMYRIEFNALPPGQRTYVYEKQNKVSFELNCLKEALKYLEYEYKNIKPH